MLDKTGQQTGNYRLIRLLGGGGFAEVYLGQHVLVQHLQAAIKVLRTQLAEDHQAEFLQEANTIALLKHPNIIRILDFGIESGDNAPYLIMDYAPNGTLRHRHPKGSLVPLATVVAYIKQIAEALQYAHDHNLIHRDLKPENLLVGENGEILLSDFGIAALAHSTSSMQPGTYAGTIPYSAPEQIKGKPQPASDQYSLGIIVYEWLSSQRPFSGDTLQLMYQHEYVSPLPLREKVPTIPTMVEAAIMKALAKDYKQRFGSIQAFATAFEQACMSPSHQEFPRIEALPSQSAPNGMMRVQFSSQDGEVVQQSQPGVVAAANTTPVLPTSMGENVRTRGVVPPRGKLLVGVGVILLLVALLSVIGGVGVYNTHIRQMNADATATATTRMAATAEATANNATATAQAGIAATATVIAANPYGGTLVLNDPLHDNSLGHW